MGSSQPWRYDLRDIMTTRQWILNYLDHMLCRDVQLAMVPLERVFLNVVQEAERHAAEVGNCPFLRIEFLTVTVGGERGSSKTGDQQQEFYVVTLGLLMDPLSGTQLNT